MKHISRWVLAGLLFTAIGCNGTGTTTTTSKAASGTAGPNIPAGTPRNIAVSWTANPEKDVNSSGGGYKVYYSTTSGFALTSGLSVSVPYTSGAATPHTVVLPALPTGTYYVKVVAYSTLNPTGSVSTQTSVTVP